MEQSKPYRFEMSFEEKNLLFYDVRQAPFAVYGLYDAANQPVFRRLPEDVAAATSENVSELALDTAGGRVRFSTDSPYVVIKAVMPKVCRFDHMPLTGTTGMDLYVDSDGGSHYHQTLRPSLDVTDGYELLLRFENEKMRSLTLNLPPYNHLDALYIGVHKTARVEKGRPYRNAKPLVYYGSSITQGACASRPGLSYENIIARRYDLDYVNLGFSGSGKAELPLVDYMASMDMLAFVSDYDYNASDAAYLGETHYRMYEIIRAAHPDIPYVMVSAPKDRPFDTFIDRRDVVIDSYRRACEQGDKNVYYIDGEGMFRGPDADSCTVDGTHPNDLGMMKMADSIGKVLERALRYTDLGGETNE